MPTAPLTFSLIITTVDRAPSLQTLLHALEQQFYPHFEVIVIVGPTRDHTLEILARYENRIRLLRAHRARLSRSRNIGLQAARGDIVAFLDDDAVPSPRWVEQLAQLFEDATLDATGGRVDLIHPEHAATQHYLGVISSLGEQRDTPLTRMDALEPPGKGRLWISRMMGTNMAFRRSALLAVGGFDAFFEYYYDDTDVAFRMAAAGYNVLPVKEAVVYHMPAANRYRQPFTVNYPWASLSRTAVYFIVRNGQLAGESHRAILHRFFQYVRDGWRRSGHLRRDGELSFQKALRLRTAIVYGSVAGLVWGFIRSGKHLPALITWQDAGEAPGICPFQNASSNLQPSVDPISGYRPSVTLQEPPLRICLLSGAYPPADNGGVARLTHLMAKGLFECGHEVHVLTRGEKEIVSFREGAYVHQVVPETVRYERYRALPSLYQALNYSHLVHDRVKRLVLNHGVQIVDSPVWLFEGLVTAMSGELPVAVRVVTAMRQIADIHQDNRPDYRLLGDMEQALLEKAAFLLPNTRGTLEAIGRAYGMTPETDRYAIVPYGLIPVAEALARPPSPDALPDTPTVLYVGRLEKRKGIMDLFQAIPLVLEKMPNARFILAGADNSRHDGFYDREKRDYASYFHRRFQSSVPAVMFKGAVSDDELNRLYQTCDLFVAPSLYESFGLIYLEAMNYAKPVIGCRTGGVPEVIEEGVTGLLVDPEAPVALAEAIVSALQNPRRLNEMGQAGRQRLLDQFTYLRMARRFAEAYRTTLRQWRPPS